MALLVGPFAESIEYQRKVLAQMLVDPHFCKVAASALTDEDFDNKILQYYFTKIGSAEIPLTPTTLREELMKDHSAHIIHEDDISKYEEMFRIIEKPPVPAEVDYINEHLLNFIRRQACVRALLDGPEILKTGDFAEIERRIVEAANAGADIMSKGLDYFGEYEVRIKGRKDRDIERKLATGITELDTATFGGIKTKQLGLCVGGTGRGKSLFLQFLAETAVLLDKNVVYYTFELSDEDMADRFDSLFTHIRPKSLTAHETLALRKLSTIHKRFGSRLIIKEYPENQATVFDIQAHLLQLTNQGFMPDLVLVDYVDLVKAHQTYGDKTQEQTDVIVALRGVAKNLNTRIWTACQLNRVGMQEGDPNEGSIAGGVSRLYTCDIAIMMAQTDAQREDEEMRLKLVKNRNGSAGKTIQINTEFDFLNFYLKPKEKEEADDDTGTSTSNGSGSDTDSSGVQGDDVSKQEGDVLILP